jgi:hypothetical protein
MENGNLRIKNDKIFKNYFTSLNVKHFCFPFQSFARQSLSKKDFHFNQMKIEICERKIMKKSIEAGFTNKNANLAKTYMKQKNKNIVQITSGKGPVECEFFVQETFSLMKKEMEF